jgi:hypothetical protein
LQGAYKVGRYLEALKNLENGASPYLTNQKNPSTASNLGLLGSPPAIFPEKKQAAPPISKLCQWLQIDPVEVFAQGLFDEHDLLLFELGTYTTQQIITYLVSWQLGGCTVPFALIKTDALLAYISKLPTDNQRMITAWLTVNIKEKTGGANG